MSVDFGSRDLPKIVGFWDYVWDPDGAPRVVVVDNQGAGVLTCATIPGNQLIHLQCSPGQPCQVHKGGSR